MFCDRVERRVLDGAVCSFLVDQLQRDPLCLSASLTKISLCFWKSGVGHSEGCAAEGFSQSFHHSPIE